MNDTKRQVLPSGLWVVATPIGNLGDMTPRALDALQIADVILCEDTRRTAALLSALGVMHFIKRLDRLDAHTESHKVDRWVQQLADGRNIALVTDAGTPAISDPGSALVAAAHTVGIRVTPLPGCSAVVAFLSASGFSETSFNFGGFFPRKKEEQKQVLELADASSISRVYVWFESPQRITESLAVISEQFPDIKLVAAKELTKLHEHLFAGTASEVYALVCEEIKTEGALGEWCFGMQFKKKEIIQLESIEWVKALQCLCDAGVKASEAAKLVSQHFGTAKKVVYDKALHIFGKK
jgi:16S rRNA (cytidine1402-2'-O)-methyltransferase